jgi:plastocyanin
MTWRWRICSELLAISLSISAAAAADLNGLVELTNSREASVRRNKDYSGVVLWLVPVDSASVPAPPKHVEMLQKDKTFTPHVVAIPVGGTVDFPNQDPFFHNAFSSFAGQPFDVGLYPPGTSRSVLFKHAGLVRVFCQIHPTMSAVIAVVSTPWYTVTPNTGKFTITGVPPGDYHLRVFHERALPENLQFIERVVTIPSSGLTLPLISISETGYIPAPHLDKHGKPYPPVSGYGGGGR